MRSISEHIYTLHLGPRTEKALLRAGIEYIDELRDRFDSLRPGVPQGLGAGGIREVADALGLRATEHLKRPKKLRQVHTRYSTAEAERTYQAWRERHEERRREYYI